MSAATFIAFHIYFFFYFKIKIKISSMIYFINLFFFWRASENATDLFKAKIHNIFKLEMDSKFEEWMSIQIETIS